MNNNEESLISHALKLYKLQYNDNIKLDHYSTRIEVSRRKLKNYSIILSIYSGAIDMSYTVFLNPSSNLNINIRSFINHWVQYYNFDKKITSVAVCKCSRNRFDVKILCNDDCWYYVLSNPCSPVDCWIIYNW